MEIFLLRHAAAQAQAATDQVRPLSALGEQQAKAAGAWLKDKLRAVTVLCSPALRTVQTHEIVARSFQATAFHLVPSIYEATAGTLLALLDEYRDMPQVLLIGHNPGIETACALLHSGRSEPRGMPTAAIAQLKVQIGSSIEPGCAELQQFWWPD